MREREKQAIGKRATPFFFLQETNTWTIQNRLLALSEFLKKKRECSLLYSAFPAFAAFAFWRSDFAAKKLARAFFSRR
jgi:hypothetical protein